MNAPLTKAKLSGTEFVQPDHRIKCYVCGKPGGILIKIDNGRYRHLDCGVK